MTLTEARTALKWTPADLDREAGLDKGTTRDIETGRNRNPTWNVIARLIDALRRGGMPGVTAEQVFGDVKPHEEVRS